ncbi:MAG: hypothetical protein LBS02_10445 [Hungatella sp.]|jgi:hypothetical protein|nr:hypothetical protein [Hungatella sp.]
MAAVAEQGDTTGLILDALATYAGYKEKFPGDYRDSDYWDRIEGTATYYEIMAGLYLSYPDKVTDYDSLRLRIRSL